MMLHVILLGIEEPVSKADDLSQCTENWCINSIFEAGYYIIVLHQKDAVEWNPQIDTQSINLKCKNYISNMLCNLINSQR